MPRGKKKKNKAKRRAEIEQSITDEQATKENPFEKKANPHEKRTRWYWFLKE